MHLRMAATALLTTMLLNNCYFALAVTSPGSIYGPIQAPITGKNKAEANLKNIFSLSAKSTHGRPLVEKYLLEGRLADGEVASLAELSKHHNNDQARMGLGALQFLRAVELLARDLYRVGVRESSANGFLSFLSRLPVKNNPNPETLTYPEARTIVDTFRENLLTAEASLSLVTDPKVKLPLHFGIIRMDINGDGHADDDESLWQLYEHVARSKHISAEQAASFYITFDRGDVHWLRGYCHLLATVCEVYLAHDTQESFDCTAHLLFTKVDSPYKFLAAGKHEHRRRFDDVEMLDLVGFIHSIRWPVVEPKRMENALHHLEVVVVQSRESWKYIMSETDDDREWLPNPRQTGVIPNVGVTEEMVVAWADIMNEIDRLLAGELLIPFWRGDDGRGINLRRVFLEPRPLDLVYWVQGTAAVPYLEKGRLTEPRFWRRSQDAFGGNFPGFALYFN